MIDMQYQNAGLNVVCLDFILILHLLLSDSYTHLHIHVEGTHSIGFDYIVLGSGTFS